MKIAIIGSGISGVTCAHYLSQHYDVDVFERSDYVGGQADTHDIREHNKILRIDTAFALFNERTAPNFAKLLSDLGCASQPTQFTLGVHDTHSDFEYNSTNIHHVLRQGKNLLKSEFYLVFKDIIRFHRDAPNIYNGNTSQSNTGETVHDYLQRLRYSTPFKRTYFMPMACALWQLPVAMIERMPMQYVVDFLSAHGMFTKQKNQCWRVVKYGSKTYIEAFLNQFNGAMYTKSAINGIHRTHNTDHQGIRIDVNGQSLFYDKVVVATHAHHALPLLLDATPLEKQLLRVFNYTQNNITLHTDTSVLAPNQSAWGSVNTRIDNNNPTSYGLHFHMNTVQAIHSNTNYICSVDVEPTTQCTIKKNNILRTRTYFRPIIDDAAKKAQTQWHDLNAQQNQTFFCGSYWGDGFHEDGVSSALRVVKAIREQC